MPTPRITSLTLGPDTNVRSHGSTLRFWNFIRKMIMISFPHAHSRAQNLSLSKARKNGKFSKSSITDYSKTDTSSSSDGKDTPQKTIAGNHSKISKALRKPLQNFGKKTKWKTKHQRSLHTTSEEPGALWQSVSLPPSPAMIFQNFGTLTAMENMTPPAMMSMKKKPTSTLRTKMRCFGIRKVEDPPIPRNWEMLSFVWNWLCFCFVMGNVTCAHVPVTLYYFWFELVIFMLFVFSTWQGEARHRRLRQGSAGCSYFSLLMFDYVLICYALLCLWMRLCLRQELEMITGAGFLF